MKTIIFFISLFSLLLWGGVRAIKSIGFNQHCSGYLKRAANANTVELASRELEVAIHHLQDNQITYGFTSVLYRTPDEDVKYWFDNLTASLDELKGIKMDASPLERSNVLMKLRETLMDNGEGGDKLTMPDGISIFPKNKAYFWWGLVSLVGLGGAALAHERNSFY